MIIDNDEINFHNLKKILKKSQSISKILLKDFGSFSLRFVVKNIFNKHIKLHETRFPCSALMESDQMFVKQWQTFAWWTPRGESMRCLFV